MTTQSAVRDARWAMACHKRDLRQAHQDLARANQLAADAQRAIDRATAGTEACRDKLALVDKR